MSGIRGALKRLSYGVYVVSARRGDEINAMTCRMVSQVSLRPPCVSLAIAKRRYTHEFICESRAFTVNILGDDQAILGGHFGLRTGRDMDKCAGVEWITGQTGAPIMAECCAWLECRLMQAVDVGHCTLFIGEVVDAGTHPESPHKTPLVYCESDYYC